MVPEWHEMSALALGQAIAEGRIDPVALAEHFLARIAERDPAHKIYLATTEARAKAEAEAARKRAKAGLRLSPLDGVPISWKDVYNLAGLATSHGSPLLANNVAERDAPLVVRASHGGLVSLGKTNCPDFCFAGIGINPHFGTPENPFDAKTPRVPGGSSSGAAVSIARGLAPLAMGSDTGGSIRIPAAWNGLVGLKTTFGLLPTEGMAPLSPTLDTAGPLARNVADANALFAILAGRPAADLSGAALLRARIGVAKGVVWDGAEAHVAACVREGIERLRAAGAEIVEDEVPEFAEADALLKRYGPYHSAEAYALWGELVERDPSKVFRPVYERMRLGLSMNAVDLERERIGLSRLSAQLHTRLAQYDALALPTVPISPPPIARLEDGGQAYIEANNACLRNTRLGNFLVTCAITLPCGRDGLGLPTGLMLMARPCRENALLRLAAAAEKALGEPGP